MRLTLILKFQTIRLVDVVLGKFERLISLMVGTGLIFLFLESGRGSRTFEVGALTHRRGTLMGCWLRGCWRVLSLEGRAVWMGLGGG